jgi:hypothetical protein
MSTQPCSRWRSYMETRTQEVLEAASKDDLEKLLFLIRHHLERALSDLKGPAADESCAELARRTIDRRITPALLALKIIAEGGVQSENDAST